MPIVGGLDIHRKQITFDYLCDMRPLAVSERVRGGQRLRGIAGQTAVSRVGDDRRITNSAAGWHVIWPRSRSPAAAV